MLFDLALLQFASKRELKFSIERSNISRPINTRNALKTDVDSHLQKCRTVTEQDCQTTYEQECFEDSGEQQCETVNEQVCQQVSSQFPNMDHYVN